GVLAEGAREPRKVRDALAEGAREPRKVRDALAEGAREPRKVRGVRRLRQHRRAGGCFGIPPRPGAGSAE
ncbi:MAG TPA: hypothetical protein VNP03_17795, partial [Pseudonocardia sp.]|nr:hypothetical protein [Pseudonocardia sp.]